MHLRMPVERERGVVKESELERRGGRKGEKETGSEWRERQRMRTGGRGERDEK